MTKKVIINDALSKEAFEKVQEQMMSLQYNWHFGEGVADPSSKGDFQFVHTIHEGYHMDSQMEYQVAYPIMEVIQPQVLIRIKANLLTKTEGNEVHGMHVDTIAPGALTAIYYVNTNNGYTIFDDGDKVESVANRLVIFPANIKHSGATCTDELRRVVINFNFIPWRDDKKWHALMAPEDITYRNHWEQGLDLPLDNDGWPIADNNRIPK
jgi:hypothetical protein|tara:strand:- start:473 stop:1102 length:630 start_codon:yes stop_codon:yes gene_type:complete